MQYISFAIIIIVGIIISILKAQSLKKRKEEQARHEQEKSERAKREQQRREQERREQAQRESSAAESRQAAARDPFPTYKINPFDDSITYASSLTAAQLNEWMLDFAAAEKAGAARPEISEIKPLFARYLYESGFNYRLLRKIRGYTPQNRLTRELNFTKHRPDLPACSVTNEHFDLPQPEQKTQPSAYLRQKSVSTELPKKNFKDRRALYESFYLNKD